MPHIETKYVFTITARIGEAFPHLTSADIAAALRYEREHAPRSA